ncbi:hypothetical protein HBI18_088230 [Parastagonospora nodorum]|nr:hypothetical protein HBI78_013420 [Parastagonospora nodorum]KAH5184070.1 hypothetical protein HBH77_178210 [Parastagonospora nodorum]KAH5732770.1 hypothetical protein HBI18_088230 [Parastagonospora nodorum]
MSGIEVVAAVSAIISAFHGGSELLKHIKAKRRKSRQAQQDFEEKQLQDSLVSGEQQIGYRYAQDMREFGDLMRIGDVIARNQLYHITILMQGEVIKSLQMAAQYDNAVLNLAVLHEASITNKTATFLILDQLKQRLLPRMPMNRQLQGSAESSSHRSSPTIPGTTAFDPSSFASDAYVPPGVTLPPQQERGNLKHGLTNYFLKRNNSVQKSSKQPKTPDDINFSQAFQHLMNARGGEDRAAIMREIDEITDLYQDLSVNQRPKNAPVNIPWPSDTEGRRDTLFTLHTGGGYSQDPLSPTHEALHIPQNFPPTPEEPDYRAYSRQPAFNNNVFGQQNDHPSYHQQYPARNPYPQMQTQGPQPRWSSTSGTSSNYSESRSFDRDSSTSSQESPSQKPPLPLKHSSRAMSTGMMPQPMSPNAPYPYHNYQNAGSPPSSHPYAPGAERYTQPVAPLRHSSMPGSMLSQAQSPNDTVSSPQEAYSSLTYSPYATPYQHAEAQPIAPFEHPRPAPHPKPNQDPNAIPQNHPKYHLTPAACHESPKISCDRNAIQSQSPTSTSPTITSFRQTSIAPSIASTDSSNSTSLGILPGSRMSSIRSATIQSGPAGQERMMSGRPCKANNYWGFCKGAWTIREDVKKGLAIRTQPLGMYNHKDIWECVACTFKGTVFSAPHPTKKNKEVNVVDPRVVLSLSGVRYKWVFLAKSHIKKKAGDSHSEESNYGCVFCCLEDRVSSVYGGVETLMNHIALSHVADMSENVRRKAKCVVGRMPGEGEEWDINIPVFARVEELE